MTARRWTAVTVTVSVALAEAVESFLLDAGAPGLASEDDPAGVRITAHFSAAPPLAALQTYCDGLAALGAASAPVRITTATVTDDGWAENWKTHFPPLAIGRRLFVHPPWIDALPPDRLPILLDPGMAFGTGHHASTRGCLELLEAAMAGRDGCRVLDLGTGSGILAIAAVKLGAAAVWGVDIDPDACAVAAENTAANGVADRVHLGTELAAAPPPFAIVLANLFAAQLVEFAPTIAAHLAPGGIAIGAGLLASEAEAVRRAWQAVGLVPVDAWSGDGWVALAWRRPP